MVTRYCAHCGDAFHPRPQAPKQAFCSALACQRTRKRQWQKDKLLSDPDYRVNQRAAQRAWSARNDGYWRDRRQSRPVAARGKRPPLPAADAAKWAKGPATACGDKMDVWTLRPGLYHLRPKPAFPGQNGDIWLVEITPVCVSAPRKMDV